MAISFSRECEVRDLCLEYALADRVPYGDWGGTNEGERSRILRERRASARTEARSARAR